MTLKEYNIGDYLSYKDGKNTVVHVIKKFSTSPGGPMTYYDVQDPDTGAIETVHISQVTAAMVASYGDFESPVKSIREKVLDQAKKIVMKDRNLQYGSAEDNFRDIAEMWTTYSGHVFKAHDVAAMMIMVKLSRIKTSPSVADHWIDVAGYSACGAQANDVHP